MNESPNPSAESAAQRLITVDLDVVMAAMNKARAEEIALHRKTIGADGLSTRQRNRDPVHTFLAGHLGGYILGLNKAAEILKAAEVGTEAP